MAEDEKDPLSGIPSSRRNFIKKMVAAAFVAPAISSFGLDSLAAASTPQHAFPNQHKSNQHDHDDDDEDEDERRRRRRRDDDDDEHRRRRRRRDDD